MLRLRADLCFPPKMYHIHSCKVNCSIEKEKKIAAFLLSACRACFLLAQGRSAERNGVGCDAEGKAAWHSMTDPNDSWKSWCMGCSWSWRDQRDAPSSVKKKWNHSACGLTLVSLNSDSDVNNF